MKLFDAMNQQVTMELESAYIYRQMASWCVDQEMPGMAHFMEKQAEEEVEHANRFAHFLQEVGHAVTYLPIDPGKKDFSGFLDVFEKALRHEQKVTKSIRDLAELAAKEKERRATSILQSFIDEQVEEEANFSALVTRLKRIDGSWSGLYLLDSELARR
ncbi:MAG: ferritin [Ndongobacter sp.]|nr:ferritin [Ndongobacter sp.]